MTHVLPPPARHGTPALLRARASLPQVFKKCSTCSLSNTKALIGCDDKVWTWKQYYDDTLMAAKSFMALGLDRFESVSILGFNAPEWHISNMGAIAAGGFAAGIYTTNEPPACKYILEHSSARVVVVDGQKQLDKILAIRNELPKLVAIVMWGDKPAAGINDGIGDGQAKVYSWAEFMELGKSVADDKLAARIEDQKPGHCCTLIYTSGTTGNPKAVMISHDNVTWTTRANIAHHPDFVNGPLRVVSYLPLSHIAAQLVDIHSPMAYLADYGLPSEIHFARPDALKGTLKQTLIKAKPTVFFAVPRVWEKFAEAMQAVGKTTTGLKKRIATFAKAQGEQIHAASQVGSKRSKPFFAFIAKKLHTKIKSAIGLDQARMCLSGAAPITHDTLNYFGKIGIHVLEVYGMSENTGPQSCGQNAYFKVGTCGRMLPGVEVKIDHDPSRDKPGEGEVCFRGRHVMMGYMHSPEKTAETIDAEGWLHSGDVGKVDPVTNLLGITGRIKELIIGAGGENIAPVPIEDRLKSLLPGISNAMMVGDKKKYNTVLITLRQKPDGEDSFTDELFGASLEVPGASAKTVTAAKADPVWKAYIEAGIAQYNKEAVSNAQKIQKFTILDIDFSVPGGELTSTQKLKRNVVVEKYGKIIDAMY